MDALEKLEEKINRAVTLIEKLNQEKSRLLKDNDDLKSRLSECESKLREIESRHNEKSVVVKEKLTGILDKLATLEQI